MKLTVLLAVVAVVAMGTLSGCGKSTPGTLVSSGYDETEMTAAIDRARREVNSFVRELEQPTGTHHAVKAPIEDAGEIEHFWLTDISFQNDQFTGTIGNEPGIVGNVRMGQAWSVKTADISDWMFMRDGKMHGNYTIRPLLKTLPAEEAAQYRELLAEP